MKDRAVRLKAFGNHGAGVHTEPVEPRTDPVSCTHVVEPSDSPVGCHTTSLPRFGTRNRTTKQRPRPDLSGSGHRSDRLGRFVPALRRFASPTRIRPLRARGVPEGQNVTVVEIEDQRSIASFSFDSFGNIPRPVTERSGRWLRWTITFSVAGLVFGLWWVISPHRTGDPGGRINDALQSAAVRILPTDAYDIQEISREPQWIGSCGDGVFKVGWTVVTHDVSFRSHLTPDQVRATLKGRLGQTGWTYHGDPALQRAFVDHEPVAWTYPIRNGVNAGMDVFAPSNQNYPGAWELQLTAQPVAPVGECQGG